MLRATLPSLGVIYCKIIDSIRFDDPFGRPSTIFPVQVDLGDGVDELSVAEVQDLVDRMFARSTRYATVKCGFVYDKHKQIVHSVRAGEKYILTGNMRGGYVKGDTRFGPRVTGYNGATPKPGLRWNGDDL